MNDSAYQRQDVSYPMLPINNNGDFASENALQYQIEPTKILDEIEHNLRGETPAYNNTTGLYGWQRLPGSIALLNEQGIRRVMTILQSHITKIFVLSDIDLENIENMTVDIGRALIDDLKTNWETYGVPNISAASLITIMCTNTIYATLCKARSGTYLKFLRTTTNISEVNHLQNNNAMAQQGSTGRSLLNSIFKRNR